MSYWARASTSADGISLGKLLPEGLATASDLAPFGFPWSPQLRNLSIIRELQRACEKRAWNSNNKKFVLAAFPQCVVNSLLVLLVIAFFAVTIFFRGNLELTFSFFWSCFCHCMRFITLRTRPVNFDRRQSLYLDARPFSLHHSSCRLSSCVSV